MRLRWRDLVCAWLCAFSIASHALSSAAGEQGRVPVVLDTDIGGDIDDAFALAMVIKSDRLDLRAVTTVSGDTAARARIAAKMLEAGGRTAVPVAAGRPGPGAPFAQAGWAQGFRSSALVAESAVALMHSVLQKGGGKVVLIAIGPLTNLASLLQAYPQDRAKIRKIVLMGGSVAHGYQPGSGQTRESNIASDREAAQAVFTSGVPLMIAPLDVTAATQLNTAERSALFARHSALTEALEALYRLWDQPTPTLHDSTAVTLLLQPSLFLVKPLQLEVTAEGLTQPQPGASPNAEVALQADPGALIQYYEHLFATP